MVGVFLVRRTVSPVAFSVLGRDVSAQDSVPMGSLLGRG